MSHNSVRLKKFAQQPTRQLIFSKSLESFGFSVDHPHTTYLTVLKTLFFGGCGQLTRDLEKIRRSSSINNKSELCEEEEKLTTLPLPPSLPLKEGEQLKVPLELLNKVRPCFLHVLFLTAPQSLRLHGGPAPLRLIKTLSRQRLLSRVLTTPVSRRGIF